MSMSNVIYIILHHVSTCTTNELSHYACNIHYVFHMWCNLTSCGKWLQWSLHKKSQSYTHECYWNWVKITDVLCMVDVGSYSCSYLFMITPHLKCTNGSDYKILVIDVDCGKSAAMNFRCDVSDIMKVQNNISHMPTKVIEFCDLHWEKDKPL